MNTAGLVLLLAALAAAEVPGLLRRGLRREAAAYLAMLFLAATTALPQVWR